MQLQLEQLDVLARAADTLLRDVSWAQFERILNDLGSDRSSRIAHCRARKWKENIGDFVKALLEEIDIEFVPTVVIWARS